MDLHKSIGFVFQSMDIRE